MSFKMKKSIETPEGETTLADYFTQSVDQWENKPFTTIRPETQKKSKEPEITRTIKKKNKRVRTAFTTDQLRALERTFTRFKYIDSERRRELAATLNINEKTIKVWFQNRRMKEKRESSESSCDSSSEALDVPPPPYRSPMADQVDSTTFCHGNVNEGLNTSTVEHSNHQSYSQSYQPVDYQTQVYQVPPLNSSAFVYDTNVYPTQYYPNPNGYYNGYYSNAHPYSQNLNEQNYENWLENFDVGY